MPSAFDAELGQLLQTVQRLYGLREPNWQEEVRLHRGRAFTDRCSARQDGKVVVWLNEIRSASDDWRLFDLSHEAIHVLNPPCRRDVTYLEEGIAASFSLSQNYNDQDFATCQRDGLAKREDDDAIKYDDALRGAEYLEWKCPGSIKELRGSDCRPLSSVTGQEY